MQDQPKHRQYATAQGFTLIELLIVLFIIGLLVSILLPVLTSARASAVGTLCLANQNQLMTGVHQHAAEHDGEVPYGPIEPGPGQLNGADDFYFINGMTTSQVSSKTGQPVGAGLMLDRYLSSKPEVLFCPGSDQPIDANHQLAQVGKGSVISGYIYRHGSNTNVELLNAFGSGDRLDDVPRLGALGKNSQGLDIAALFADNNFLANAFSGAFYRSNHRELFVNIAYADGHVEQRDNRAGRYSADISGTNLYAAIYKMRAVLERADAPE